MGHLKGPGGPGLGGTVGPLAAAKGVWTELVREGWSCELPGKPWDPTYICLDCLDNFDNQKIFVNHLFPFLLYFIYPLVNVYMAMESHHPQ